MQPIKTTVIGTGIGGPFVMDYLQNPFNVLVSVSATNATYTVEFNPDWAVVSSPTWNGTSGLWFPINSSMQTTAAATTGNIAYPVAALRLNVLQATNATSASVIYVTQASNVP